jgi:hypothetical protein
MPADRASALTCTAPEPTGTDHFLSEEDLDLANLSWNELLAVWDAWLRQASATDDTDAHLYSHGVFTSEPGRAERGASFGG